MVAKSETLGGALEDVRAFCAVMELGSISAAARQLQTTKGGLSRRVSRLERHLGVKLLARTPRAVSATEEGAAFHAKARDGLVVLDEAADTARQSQSEPRGHLRVTAPVDIGVDVLPPLMAGFREVHPKITVELVTTDASLDLAAQQIDLALRASLGDLPDMGYRASTLSEFNIAAYTAPDYLKKRKAPKAPADLADHCLVMTPAFGRARVTLTNRRGRKQAVTLRPAIRVSDFASASRMIQAGAGIGALPDIIAAPGVKSGQLVRVLPDWNFGRARLFAISLAGREAPARVRAFKEFVREKLAEMCGG